MKGSLSHELELGLPAADIWSVYREIRIAELVVQLLPNIIEKFEVIEGDGGVGTLLHFYFPPGTPLGQSYKERFTTIDDEKRVKEAEVVEGGHLDLGFRYYMIRFEILEKDSSSSIVRSTIEYELNDEFAANASFVSTGPVAIFHETVGKYLMDQRKANI